MRLDRLGCGGVDGHDGRGRRHGLASLRFDGGPGDERRRRWWRDRVVVGQRVFDAVTAVDELERQIVGKAQLNKTKIRQN